MIDSKNITHNLEVLSFLECDEDFHIKKDGRFVKVLSPDRFLREAEGFFMRYVHQGITFVLKAVRALEKKWSKQSSEQNLEAINKLATEILQIDGNTPERNKITLYVEQHLVEGLKRYRETLLTGKMQLFPPAKQIRQEHVDRLDAIISRVQNEVLPKLNEEIKNTVAMKNECAAVSSLLACLESGASRELSVEHYVKDVVVSALQSRYGDSAVERIMDYYHLNDMHVLTGEDIAALVTGIKANLTLDDLQQYLALQNKTLPSEKECFRLLVELRKHWVSAGENKNKPYCEQLKKDIAFLECKGHQRLMGKKNQDNLKKFSYYEHLSREISYALFRDSKTTHFAEGVLLPVYDLEGRAVLKQAHLICDEKGVNAALIRPVFVADGDVPIDIVFRGTNCQESLKRCVSVNHWHVPGPGEDSFEDKCPLMFSAIDKNLADLKNRSLHLTISGHSLGASDSLRMAEKYAERLAQGEEKHHIKTIGLHCYNTPGIERNKLKNFLDHVKNVTTPFTLRYFDNYGDPVQEAGYGRLGHCEDVKEWPSNLSISIFESRSNRINRNRPSFWELQQKGYKVRRVHSYASSYAQEDGVFENRLQRIITNCEEDYGISAPLEVKGKEHISLIQLELRTIVGNKVHRKWG